MTKDHKAIGLSIIETKDGLALDVATEKGERITIETTPLLLRAFVEQAAKAIQDHARKQSRH